MHPGFDKFNRVGNEGSHTATESTSKELFAKIQVGSGAIFTEIYFNRGVEPKANATCDGVSGER